MMAVIFGKPLVGKPIAALHINTEAITSKFGCGCGIPLPTLCTSGRKMSAATVCDMNVATTNMMAANVISTPYKDRFSTRAVICSASVFNRPEDLTAFPNERPPAARMMMVQRKLLKSSFVRMPVPKNKASGMIAITPMSPSAGSWCEKHHNAIVMSVTTLINHWIPVKGSLMERIGTIFVPLDG